jgi:hypothetical protein
MKMLSCRGILIAVSVFIFSFMFARPALADPGNPHGVKQEVDGIVVELVFTAEPLKSGRNGVIVRLEGASHQPLDNAQVTVTLVAHEAAEADEHDRPKKDSHSREGEDDHVDEPKVYNLKAGHGPGEYEGNVSFSRAGEWEVHVRFIVDGQEKEAVFVVDVEPGSGPWLLLGSFFGANTAIIAAAVVLRSKKSQEIS